jgi:hypothetical protein
MPPKTPTKKKVSSAKKTPLGFATGEDLSKRLNSMSMSGSKLYDYAWKHPFHCLTYNQGLDVICKVEFFVPVLPENYFFLDVVNNGTLLEVRTRIPNHMFMEERVLASNSGVAGFNANTSEAQAHKDLCEYVVVDNENGLTGVIFGQPQLVELPFQCEERIVTWEIEAFTNDLENMNETFGAQQYHTNLKVVLRKLKTKRRIQGRIRVVGNLVDDGVSENDDDAAILDA